MGSFVSVMTCHPECTKCDFPAYEFDGMIREGYFPGKSHFGAEFLTLSANGVLSDQGFR